MDNLKRRIMRAARVGWVLGPGAAILVGCASPPAASVPRRSVAHAAFVVGARDDVAPGRNDARLGTPRQPFARISAEGFATVDDRQWIVNGRTYDDYASRTRSASRFGR